jgi:hypothetical protein
METLEEIALVFKEVLVNKPFKKEEQIDLFTKLAISNFENIKRKQFPCDEFYDWWTEIGGPRAGNKQDKRIKTKREKEEFDNFLMSEEVPEWFKSTWIVEYVLSKIPND